LSARAALAAELRWRRTRRADGARSRLRQVDRVAGPILRLSDRIADEDLVENAQSMSSSIWRLSPNDRGCRRT